ncbi:GNAT family N-acetyltransferase [Spirosoma agri]|uniref:GNAT family N-acetyltransferase n=1 Tax=Spirosoma agri TaxID=1987381 RepID=A0A6M0ITA5_9BACT|nr:GNAT family N-acetyltransferase [Spirosoma agri]NEU70433.1 GNAT family N-acetyltransferase [Spirosoma agri]
MIYEYTISDDKTKLDLAVIHRFLSQEAYWCPNIPVDIVQRSIENSLCFGVYLGEEQVGFARVVSDLATFGYLADVFILPAHRGRGLSKKLVAFILAYPTLQGLRRMLLVTRDAHGLYEQFGFQPIDNPENTLFIKLITSY